MMTDVHKQFYVQQHDLGLLHSDEIVYKAAILLRYIYTCTGVGRHVHVHVCINKTRNAWQSLAYSPLGAVVSPPSEYL